MTVNAVSWLSRDPRRSNNMTRKTTETDTTEDNTEDTKTLVGEEKKGQRYQRKRGSVMRIMTKYLARKSQLYVNKQIRVTL